MSFGLCISVSSAENHLRSRMTNLSVVPHNANHSIVECFADVVTVTTIQQKIQPSPFLILKQRTKGDQFLISQSFFRVFNTKKIDFYPGCQKHGPDFPKKRILILLPPFLPGVLVEAQIWKISIILLYIVTFTDTPGTNKWFWLYEGLNARYPTVFLFNVIIMFNKNQWTWNIVSF